MTFFQIKNFSRYLEPTIVIIDKDCCNDDTMNDFVKVLRKSIQKYCFENIHLAIKLNVVELSGSRKVIFETASCKTFEEKVCDYTGLERLKLFQLLMPAYEAELYFFCFLSEDRKKTLFDKQLLTKGYYNNQATNSLCMKIKTSISVLRDISFIGYVEIEEHRVLKRFIDAVLKKLKNHVDKFTSYKQSDEDEEIHVANVVDLTVLEEDHESEINDEDFYDINTSDVMEIDTQEDYYDYEMKGLCEGWDDQVELSRFQTYSYDGILMERYVDMSVPNLEYEEEMFNEESNETIMPSIPEEAESSDLEITEILEPPKQPKIQKIDKNVIRRKSTPHYIPDYSLKRTELTKVNKPEVRRSTMSNFNEKKKIKSKLFSEEETLKWQNAKKSDMTISEILSMGSSEGLSTLNNNFQSFKIPKKTHDESAENRDIDNLRKTYGPSARRPIHDQKEQSIGLSFFNSCIKKIVPYDSPSAFKSPSENRAPASISSFIDSKSCVIEVDDDEDWPEENNNSTLKSNESDHTQHPPIKRKLGPISPKKFFKNRAEKSSSDFSFSSTSRRNLCRKF